MSVKIYTFNEEFKVRKEKNKQKSIINSCLNIKCMCNWIFNSKLTFYIK